MKIVLLLSNELKQYYVIRELFKHHRILGVVIENKYTPGYRVKAVLQQFKFNPFEIARIVYRKIKIRKYELKDKKIIESYFLEKGKPIIVDHSIPVLKANNINTPKATAFIKELSPELIVIFGTSLVKEKIISIPKVGIINAHTGISPYYRGGQCAFWCLYNDEPEYIGVTVHWLSRGIDSGDIILQERPHIEENDNLCSIECKLAILATELLKKTIDKIERGVANRAKQETKGRLYLSKEFTLNKRLEFEKRLKDGLIKKYLNRKSQVYDRVKIVND